MPGNPAPSCWVLFYPLAILWPRPKVKQTQLSLVWSLLLAHHPCLALPDLEVQVAHAATYSSPSLPSQVPSQPGCVSLGKSDPTPPIPIDAFLIGVTVMTRHPHSSWGMLIAHPHFPPKIFINHSSNSHHLYITRGEWGMNALLVKSLENLACWLGLMHEMFWSLRGAPIFMSSYRVVNAINKIRQDNRIKGNWESAFCFILWENEKLFKLYLILKR